MKRDYPGAGPPSLPLLESVDLITPAWLQQVFRQAGCVLPPISQTVSRSIGHGNLSDTVVTTLRYEDGIQEAPSSVVCKFTSSLPAAVRLAEKTGAYLREVMTYRLFGVSPPLRVPRVYAAETDAASRRLNLVMEDLSAFAEPGDQITGCRPVDAFAAISELASLHARFWNDPVLDGLDWLFNSRSRSGDAAAVGFQAGARVCADRFRGRLPGEVFDAIESFAPGVADWSSMPAGRKTLIHREARVDNIMFDHRDPASVRAYIIDWQFTSAADPQFDVAYFASGSLTPEDRRACEMDLVRSHAARVREVDPTYSDEEALDAYRFYLPSGLVTTLASALVLPPGEHEDMLLMTLLTRNVAALMDWGLVQR
jgi:hypothetical protein